MFPHAYLKPASWTESSGFKLDVDLADPTTSIPLNLEVGATKYREGHYYKIYAAFYPFIYMNYLRLPF
jgi:hypothetical protein